MSDDVFEDELRAPAQRGTPSPTGYKDYHPAETPLRTHHDDDMPIHKTILLGDSGVGKTSLLVQFETGRFQAGNFSATVGIGFTTAMEKREMEKREMEKRIVVGRVRPTWALNLPGASIDEDHSEAAGILPHSDPPSPLNTWEQHLKPDDSHDVFGKVMLLGDSGVGKTCMLVRFRDGRFPAGNYISTVGIDFRNKIVMVDRIKVKLQIWDTAGQERFRSVTHAYYRDAHALLLLYDVTNKTSFDNIRAWLGEIREYAQDDVVIMLLGNKSDSGLERAVRCEEGHRLAREYRVSFMETSAKTGLNVEAAFGHVAQELVGKANPADPTRLEVRVQAAQEPKSPCQSCV